MLDSLEFVHKLSQHFNAREDAAERMLSPDLRGLGVMFARRVPLAHCFASRALCYSVAQS